MPASLHRQNVCELFENDQNALIYLKGASPLNRHGTDYEFPFRQESNFWYLSGVDEPDYEMILEVKSGIFHLFAPKRTARYAVWHGRIKPAAEIRESYAPDHLHLKRSAADLIRELNAETLYCLNEHQADSLPELPEAIRIDTRTLKDALIWARSIKTEWELNQLREAARINNLAHTEVLRALRPGMAEYECKALFEYHQVRNGLVQDAYGGIHASGPNSAILHYTGNRRTLSDGELYLIDAGHEQNGYASDVTRTYPVNGTFSGQQAAIYQIVLDAQNSAIRNAQAGVKMEDLHLLSSRIILEGLREEKLIRGDLDELMEKNIFALFFPHGLGHFLGLDTHDVGGYPKGVERINRPGLRHLRVRRELAAGMVITIEPGIYFIPALLQPAFSHPEKAGFLNRRRIEPLLDFGGIRIEDNLIIRKGSAENLTSVVKEIREIEKAMKSR